MARNSALFAEFCARAAALRASAPTGGSRLQVHERHGAIVLARVYERAASIEAQEQMELEQQEESKR